MCGKELIFTIHQTFRLVITETLNSSPNDNFLYWTKFKAFADDKLHVPKIMISVFNQVENIEGKGESAPKQEFLLRTQCFQKASFLGSLKLGIVWQRITDVAKIDKNGF